MAQGGEVVSSRRASLLWRAGWLVVLVIIAAYATWAGLELRAWTWQTSKPIRFIYDVNNGRDIGLRIVRTPLASNLRAGSKKIALPEWGDVWDAYLDRYDRELRGSDRGWSFFRDNQYRIDYPPGRLLVVTAWMYGQARDRGVLSVAYRDDIVTPMLNVNSAHTWAAALGAFFLVRRALRNSGAGLFKSESLGLLSALLLWFNPPLILDSHGWPQWDAWVLPYFIWAAYFGLVDRWMLTGVMLAAGAMMKGQVLLAAPLFVLWPLFRLNIDALLRALMGFVFAVALLMTPWLIGRAHPPAMVWSIGAIVLFVLHLMLPRVLRCGWTWWLVGLAMAVWVIAPAIAPGAFHIASAGELSGALVALAVAAVLLPSEWRGRRFAALAGFMAAILFIAAGLFEGSFAWLRVGFQTDRYPAMSLGVVANLPSILAEAYGFDVHTPTTSLWGLLDRPLDLRTLLRSLAFVGTVLVALGIARQQRKNDANLLVGFVAVWVILYGLTPQMHERYLVWGAAMSALLVARSWAGLAAYVAISAAQMTTLFLAMVRSSPYSDEPTGRWWVQALTPLVPWVGFVTITLAGVLLVWTWLPSRQRMAVTAVTRA